MGARRKRTSRKVAVRSGKDRILDAAERLAPFIAAGFRALSAATGSRARRAHSA